MGSFSVATLDSLILSCFYSCVMWPRVKKCGLKCIKSILCASVFLRLCVCAYGRGTLSRYYVTVTRNPAYVRMSCLCVCMPHMFSVCVLIVVLLISKWLLVSVFCIYTSPCFDFSVVASLVFWFRFFFLIFSYVGKCVSVELRFTFRLHLRPAKTSAALPKTKQYKKLESVS